MEKDNQNNVNENSVGLGVDIVDVARMKDIIENTPSFLEGTFSEEEIKYCKSSTRYVEHFATHFAAKEAVLKALGCGFAEGVMPTDVEVSHTDTGKPFAILHGRVKGIAEEKKVKDIPISLSFTNTEAVGFAIALTEESAMQNKVFDKSKDPMAQLAKQFKEAKKILDEKD